MPNSLKCRLKKLEFQGLLNKKDLSRIYTDNDVIEELEKLKAEMLKKVWRDAQGQIVSRDGFNHGIITATDIIDNHISELKGENK